MSLANEVAEQIANLLNSQNQLIDTYTSTTVSNIAIDL